MNEWAGNDSSSRGVERGRMSGWTVDGFVALTES
jgi:hypothetical protein